MFFLWATLSAAFTVGAAPVESQPVSNVIAFIWRDFPEGQPDSVPPGTVYIERNIGVVSVNPFTNRWLLIGDEIHVKAGGEAVLVMADLTRTNLYPGAVWPPKTESSPKTLRAEISGLLDRVLNKRQNFRLAGSRAAGGTRKPVAIVALDRTSSLARDDSATQTGTLLVYWIAPTDFGTNFTFELLSSPFAGDLVANLVVQQWLSPRHYTEAGLPVPVSLRGALVRLPAPASGGDRWLQIRQPERGSSGRSKSMAIPTVTTSNSLASQLPKPASGAIATGWEEQLIQASVWEAVGCKAIALRDYIELLDSRPTAAVAIAMGQLLDGAGFGDLADEHLRGASQTKK